MTQMLLVTAHYTLLFVGTPNNVYSFMVMKIGICILLLALTVVTVVLIYFVKKKVCTECHIHNTIIK